ncbi:MAG: alpha/beta hydrolase [Chloroflexaceae bacterium]|nr:alpha/beta hydrolase [Chloroflexaceae bacterium]
MKCAIQKNRYQRMFQRILSKTGTTPRNRARHRAWRRIVLGIVGVLAIGAAATAIAYTRDMQAIHDRLQAGSQLIETRHGPLEYTTWGDGPPVLVIHGAGGGYDQGISIAQAYGGDGFRWISPSRFGYLRSPLPADVSTAAQADAFADLLDTLEIEQVAILAMSGGVPPALQFAQRYPDRTVALVLLSSAPYTPLTADEQEFPMPIWLYQALFSSDFPYWLMQHLSRSSLEPLFDITPELQAIAPPEEQLFMAHMVDSFQPVTARFTGLQNEGSAIDPAARYQLETLTMPTFVVHAQDDQINPFSFGTYTATHIPDAQFLPLETGGHLLLGHHADIRTQVQRFLQQNTTE